jgi:hypothetical protein
MFILDRANRWRRKTWCLILVVGDSIVVWESRYIGSEWGIAYPGTCKGILESC